MSRILITFEPIYDHKLEKHAKPEQQEFKGRVIPPRKHFDFFTIEKESGGVAYIPQFNITRVETFL